MKSDRQDISWLRKTLKNDGWLSQTTEAFCDALFAHTTLTTHEKGDKIFTIGDSSGLTGFATGSGMLTVHFENREPLRAHIVHPGNWIGAASIIGRSGRVTSVAAAQNCSVLTLSLEAADKILQQNPDHWQWLGLLAAQNQSISVRNRGAFAP
ncbi:MAG: cyclic nucleotide-binding domain-containing protein [Paracoccaceae bacterium]